MSFFARTAALGAVATLLACGNAAQHLSSDCSGESCTDSVNGGPNLPPVAPTYSARRLRRLSRREYDNVVRDLLGDASKPASRFIVDTYQNGYDNGSAGLAVQSEQVIGYQDAAETLADRVVKNDMGRLLGGCDVATQGESACVEGFLRSFAPRAYRRPLTETELARLRTMFATGAAVGGFTGGIRAALELILQSPQFLYREELGPREAELLAEGHVQLTPYEIASELSFLLTGSSPDDELWRAVEQGQLTSNDDYAREAVRLLGTSAAKDSLRAFMHQWLATNRLPGLTKDPKYYPSFNEAMAASMAEELDRFYDAVLWGDRGSLRDLLTSNQSFADETLGHLYGVAVSGAEFQSVTLDPDLRKGILTRAGFLAVHANADSSGPVSRGVFLLQALLCLAPPPPPANIPAPVGAGNPVAQNMTTRERFAQHVAKPGCAGCHGMIDGLGFGFEEFDALGAYRVTENGKPIDMSGTVVGTGEIDGPYDGAGQLATRIAGSRHLIDCYSRNAYRFAMGEVEPSGAGSSDWLQARFSSDARLTDLLMTIVTSPVFATRRFEP